MMDEEGLAIGRVVGLPWNRLLVAGNGVDEVEAPPPAGRAPQRLPCEVMRLPARDMHDLGRWPETDAFCTVECELCGRLMVPHALRLHMEETHVDALTTLKTKLTKPKMVVKKLASVSPSLSSASVSASASSSASSTTSSVSSVVEDARNETETATVYCSLCSAAVPSAAFRRHAIKTHGDMNTAKPLKTKTAVKTSPPKKITSKSASGSPIELTDEFVAKDLKKSAKKKKIKSSVELDKKSVKKKKDKVSIGGEYDPCNHCGVVNEDGNPCLRNIVCRLHPVALRRLVQRPFPYDVLAKITKTQNDDERRVKTETIAETPQLTITDPVDAPPVKRIKTEPKGEPAAEEPEPFKDVVQPSVVPRPKPLICWGLETLVTTPAPNASITLADLPWHSSQPRPLATNTFGCRIVGGLLTPSKKWDSLRKHIQTVWAESSQDAVGVAKPAVKAIASRKTQAAALRRKRKSSGSTTSDNLLNGLLQPTNGVNGVPLRLFNGNQPTFIQLNLCPSK